MIVWMCQDKRGLYHIFKKWRLKSKKAVTLCGRVFIPQSRSLNPNVVKRCCECLAYADKELKGAESYVEP